MSNTETLTRTIRDAKLDKRAQKALDVVSDALDDLKLDKRTRRAAYQIAAAIAAAKLDQKATRAVKDARLDKLAAQVGDTASSTIDDLQLQKRLAALTDSLPDLRLDKRTHHIANAIDRTTRSINLGKTAATVGGTVAAWQLDKKVNDLADSASSTITDLKLNEKAASVVDSATSTIKDLKLDKTASDVADSVSDVATAIAKAVAQAVHDLELDKKAASVADTVAGLELDKKAADAVDTVSSTVKDLQLDKRAASVADTVAGLELDKKAANAVSSVADLKLDRKAADLADSATSTVKSLRLDKKVADLADSATGAVKGVKLDEKAGDLADSVGDYLPNGSFERTARSLAADSKIAPDNAAGMAVVRDRLKDLGFQDRFTTLADSFGAGLNSRKLGSRSDAAVKAAQRVVRNADITTDPADVQKTVAAALAALGIEGQRNAVAKAARKAVSDEQAAMRRQYKDYRQDWAEQVKLDLRGVRFEQPKAAKEENGGGFPWGLLVLIGALTGGLAANNARIWGNVPPLESVLEGPARYHKSRQGVIFYKMAGDSDSDKTPVVFVHGIGAGASSYEWRKNYNAIAAQYPTYAFDLLGFGNSERPEFKYTPEVYIKQLTEFLDEVVGKPAYVIASSLGGAYAVQVAYRRPELIEKLVLVAPTGINRMAGQSGPAILFTWLEALLRSPIYGTAIYGGIASHGGIESFLKSQLYNDPAQVTQAQIEQYWTAAHQEGAKYAPAAFLSGNLNAEIGQTFAKITQPSLLVWGRNSTITPVHEGETLAQANPRARLEVLDGAKLGVNEEKAEQFNNLALAFLQQPTPAQPGDSASVGFVHRGAAADEQGHGPSANGTSHNVAPTSTAKTGAGEAAKVATGDKAGHSTQSNPDSSHAENAAPAKSNPDHENATPADDRKIDSASGDPKATVAGMQQTLASNPDIAAPATAAAPLPTAQAPVSLDPNGTLVGENAKNPTLTTATGDMQKLDGDGQQQHTGTQADTHAGGQLESRTGDSALG